MKLIFAQGNPGATYQRTRHNVGWMVLDALAAKEGASWKAHRKYAAELAEFQLDGEKVLLVKPLSFYNETGHVARALVDFYKLTPSADVLVIHDELALPFGTIRVRQKGSDAGNNGVKSLNTHLGSVYWRIRMGIWNEHRNHMSDADFVLSTFGAAEAEQLKHLIDDAVFPLIQRFIQGELTPSSNAAPSPQAPTQTV